MTQLSFRYHLQIDCDAPINNHRFTLRCTPGSDERQTITNLERFITPKESLSESIDAFGNIIVYGHAPSPHQHFEADVTGDAMVGLCDSVAQINPYRENIFRYATPLTKADDAISALAETLRSDVRNNYDQALYVMEAVGKHMDYVQGVTFVNTTAAEAFALGQGVCQDYSHIMLSILRAQGIKARYVVGMLMGEGLSHAWVEVEHQGRWYAFDPTNQLIVKDKHIKISHGRDYTDCMINKGCFYGFANQIQTVSVIVEEKSSTIN